MINTKIKLTESGRQYLEDMGFLKEYSEATIVKVRVDSDNNKFYITDIDNGLEFVEEDFEIV